VIPETYPLTFQGKRVIAITDNATAIDILRVAGCAIPSIPHGCNTVTWIFEDTSGRAAIGIRQAGFDRILRDDEREVNGVSLLILQESTGFRNLDIQLLEDLWSTIETTPDP